MTELERLLARLVDATPAPPEESDPEVLFEQAQALAEVRKPLNAELEVLVSLHAPGAFAAAADSVERLLAELRSRDEAWQAAIAHAKSALSDSLLALSRARRSR